MDVRTSRGVRRAMLFPPSAPALPKQVVGSVEEPSAVTVSSTTVPERVPATWEHETNPSDLSVKPDQPPRAPGTRTGACHLAAEGKGAGQFPRQPQRAFPIFCSPGCYFAPEQQEIWTPQ